MAQLMRDNVHVQELQQHDVQELNRILFSAIESSLVGTFGEQLISNFYRGTSVQQVLMHCNDVIAPTAVTGCIPMVQGMDVLTT